MKRKSFVYLRYYKVLFAKRLYKKAGNVFVNRISIKELINADMERYSPSLIRGGNYYCLSYLLLNNKVFRTQFYYRLEQDEKLGSSLLKVISKLLLKPLDNIQICKPDFLDGGLFIEHSSGCVISVHRAGRNLTVFQGVTIGDSGERNEDGIKRPKIGNNVTIFANAVVAGGIKIGDNVQIGAGSVVLKDVPDNCTVVGNPAYIVRMNGEKVKIKL